MLFMSQDSKRAVLTTFTRAIPGAIYCGQWARCVKFQCLTMSKSVTRPNHTVIPVNKTQGSHRSCARTPPFSNVTRPVKRPNVNIVPQLASIARVWAAVTMCTRKTCASVVQNGFCVAN